METKPVDIDTEPQVTETEPSEPQVTEAGVSQPQITEAAPSACPPQCPHCLHSLSTTFNNRERWLLMSELQNGANRGCIECEALIKIVTHFFPGHGFQDDSSHPAIQVRCKAFTMSELFEVFVAFVCRKSVSLDAAPQWTRDFARPGLGTLYFYRLPGISSLRFNLHSHVNLAKG